MNLVSNFIRDESGATAIEYAVIASGIGILIIASVNALGEAIEKKFNHIKNTLVSEPDVAGDQPEEEAE